MRHWTYPVWKITFGLAQGVYAILISVAIATANWVMAGVFLSGVVGIPLLFLEPVTVAIIWLIGNPTLSVLANNALAPVPGATVERALFFLLLGKFVFDAVFNKTREIRWLHVEYAIAAFMMLIALSWFRWSSAVRADVNADLALFLDGFLMPMVGFMLIRRMKWTETQATLLLRLLLLAGLYQAALGVFGTFVDISMLTPSRWEITHTDRASGTFASASEYGSVLSMFMVTALLLYTWSKSSLERFICVVSMGFMGVGLVLAETRAPWLGLLVMFAYLLVFEPRVRPLLMTGAVIGGIGGLVSLPFLVDVDAFVERITEVSPILNRIAVWAASFNIATDYPLMGVGFGSRAFQSYLWDYAISVGGVSKNWALQVHQPHNEFLSALVTTGVTGLVLYGYILYRFVRLGLFIRIREGISTLAGHSATYAVAGIIGLIVNGLVVDLRPMYYYNIQTFSLLAVVVALFERETVRVRRESENHLASNQHKRNVLASAPGTPAIDRN